MPPAELLCSLAKPANDPNLPARSMKAAMKPILLQCVVDFVRDHPLLIGGNDEGGESARGGADLLGIKT
jgi:hypothetical protein